MLNRSARAARVAPPEEVVLTTKDNVRLGATYYPSSLGREAVPIVLLHDYKEGRTVFNHWPRHCNHRPILDSIRTPC